MAGRLSWLASALCAGVLCGALGPSYAVAQNPVQPSQMATAVPGAGGAETSPIAIVPVNTSATVTGTVEITKGEALIATAGSIAAGTKAAEVILPRRGTLRVCAATSVRLAADRSVPAGDTPGLIMALDHGALETSFATGRNADVVMTPDFRILIGGPGPSQVKVRLGQHGDTCVDNPGKDAPYVLVTSVFEGATYRVQPNQRVEFQHGSLHEVVDNEKEPCGCPAEARPGSNDFPAAESAGLTVKPPPVTAPASGSVGAPGQTVLDTPLDYEAQAPSEKTEAAPAKVESAKAVSPRPAAKKPGVFRRIGRFLKKIFGAES